MHGYPQHVAMYTAAMISAYCAPRWHCRLSIAFEEMRENNWTAQEVTSHVSKHRHVAMLWWTGVLDATAWR
jgi:hypothetical protein